MRSPGDFFTIQKSKALLLTLLLCSTYFIFSILIPPFQSPDEYDHVKRSYLLAHGRIMLENPEGQSSGGRIDTGLLSYINAYKGLIGKPDTKLTSREITEADSIRWTGEEAFSPAPGTGYYFPLVYLPQAIGLKAGEVFSLTVDQSYRLARLSTLMVASIILFFAFRLYAPSFFALSLLIIPMSIFQMASTSLDVFSTALAVFSLSLFMRACSRDQAISPSLIYALSVSLFLLVSSKINLLPFIGLLLVVGWKAKGKKGLIAGLLVLGFAMLWILFALRNTVDMRISTGATTESIILFYVEHPIAFFEVLYATFPVWGFTYIVSFFGVLGWLDAPLSGESYNRLYFLVFSAFLVSVSFKFCRLDWARRGLLVACAAISSLLIFFALLITWNVHPAKVIEGVQGRYFLIPLLMLAYAVDGGSVSKSPFFTAAGAAVLALVFLVSTYSTASALLGRYYLVSVQPAVIPMQMQPSSQLDSVTSIKLGIPLARENDPAALKRIGVLFATYDRPNAGVAELRLTSKDGLVVSQQFNMSDLVDNQYRFYELQSAHVFSGEIISISGGGISVWESKPEHGKAQTCMIYDYVDGRSISTPGCPR